jgi:two-component system chemotaxis sensor kinase CheA
VRLSLRDAPWPACPTRPKTLIGHIRDGASPTPDAVTVILAAIDRIQAVLAELERSAQEPEGDDSGLVQALDYKAPL